MCAGQARDPESDTERETAQCGGGMNRTVSGRGGAQPFSPWIHPEGKMMKSHHGPSDFPTFGSGRHVSFHAGSHPLGPVQSPSGPGHPWKGVPAGPPARGPRGKPAEPAPLQAALRAAPLFTTSRAQMDDTEATFFSLSSGKMNLTKCCRHHPTRFHIHRGRGPLTARAHPSAPAGAQGRGWRQDEHFASFASSVRLLLSPEIHPLHWAPALRLRPGASPHSEADAPAQGEDEAVIRGEVKRRD